GCRDANHLSPNGSRTLGEQGGGAGKSAEPDCGQGKSQFPTCRGKSSDWSSGGNNCGVHFDSGFRNGHYCKISQRATNLGESIIGHQPPIEGLTNGWSPGLENTDENKAHSL